MAASPDDVMAMVFFARVVEQRSFTAAAAKLGVSKSVVSARVAAFERRLRVPLLHRTTRKLSLTREGLALYERCARVAAAADEAAAAADRTGDAPHGLLRVDAPIVFARNAWPRRWPATWRATPAGPRRADHERPDDRSRRRRRRRRDPRSPRGWRARAWWRASWAPIAPCCARRPPTWRARERRRRPTISSTTIACCIRC